MKFNKNRVIIVSMAAAVALLLGVALAGAAGTGDPGSAGDPLVTRSFVETSINSAVSSQVNESVKACVDKYMNWQIIELAPGQVLEGKAGSELIVRAGKTTVVDPVGSGIPDVTAGLNIIAGRVVVLDHLLIIPRTDGRGVNARTKALVMCKGDIQVR